MSDFYEGPDQVPVGYRPSYAEISTLLGAVLKKSDKELDALSTHDPDKIAEIGFASEEDLLAAYVHDRQAAVDYQNILFGL